MCSIFGIIDSDNPAKRSGILQKMAVDQHHRGPDDGGFFEDENAALGHRRLSIIDLSSNAKQPMQSSDGNIVLVFNGEIYNYQSLKKSLEEKGHNFRTASDTECIIHLFEEYGSDGFSRLDGMFAIALYDRKAKILYLLRDRVGKKPLFYFQYGRALAFASELSALKQHDAMPRELDMQSVSDYLSLLYVPCPATIYKNVFKANPSEMLIFDIKSGILSKQQYHTDNFKINNSLSFEASSACLRELVFEAVRKRLMSDVPVGVFLSGGVDSGITANIMTRLRMPQKTDAFTIGFDDPVYDESSAACCTAELINNQTDNALVHHRKNVSAS
ncbi:MAG: asparagine synthase (glutamine-hydrolyzing), partial [Lentisphaeria bacterium]|nr:asparagine synthase (glutamine-hydrolyzing) [Lentisphaeria bacterium]